MKNLRKFLMVLVVVVVCLTTILPKSFVKAEEKTNEVLPNVENPPKDESKDVSSEDVKKDETQSNETVQNSRQNRAGAFATLGGVDLSGTTDRLTKANINDAVVTTASLDINATFNADITVTNRKIEITGANGFSFDNMPGMVKSGNTFTFNAGNLPLNLQGIITNGVYTPNPSVYGSNVKSGKLVYTISPGTSSVNLSLGTSFDPLFTLNNGNYVLNNLINVKTLETTSGTENVINDQTLEEYAINQATLLYTRNEPGQGIIVAPGQQKVEKIIVGRESYTGGSVYAHILDEHTVKFSFSKQVGLQSIAPVAGGKFNFTYSIDRDSSTTLDYLTFTISNASLLGEFNLTFQPPVGAIEGVYKPTPISADYKFYNQTTATNTALGLHTIEAVTVVGANDNLLTTGDITGNFIAPSAANGTNNVQVLGGIDLRNKNAFDVTSKKIRLTFDDTNIGVRAVNILFQYGGTAKNIVVKTNKGNTYNVANLSNSTGIPTGFAANNVNLQNIAGTTRDEYITEITYDTGVIQTGANQGVRSPFYEENSRGALLYYGDFLNIPASKKISAKIDIIEENEDFSTAPVVTSHRATMNVRSENNFWFSNSTTINNLASPPAYFGGTNITLKHTINGPGYRYSNYLVNMIEGIEFYLREDKYLKIDRSTIKIIHDGVTYTEGNGLSVVETIDNTGNRVYKVVSNNIKIGSYKDDLTKETASISYDAKIRSNAPTTSISYSDLFLVKPISQLTLMNTSVSTHTQNRFDVDGSGNLTKTLGSGSSGSSLKINAQKDFTVTSAANLNNGAWASYDDVTKQMILNLNPTGSAKYQLNVSNNAGETINGYTALIPIPKAGEQTPLTPLTPAGFDASEHLQKSAFEWTVGITNEVTLSGAYNYTVMYATTYEIEKDSVNWKTWSEVSADPSQIRMLKVVTTDAIADGTSDSINFPLSLIDPNADLNSGKTNIYSSRIYKSISGTAGYKPSEPIAIRLKTGVVKGKAFYDTNRDGIYNAGDTLASGISVTAYETGTQNILATTVTKTDGTYEFLGLEKLQNADIRFTNPSITDAFRFTLPNPDIGDLSATYLNVVPSGTNFDSKDAALIAPTTITLNANTGSTAVSSMTRYPNETIATEPAAVKTGYTFNGWFSAATGGTKFNFPYTATTSNVTMYAQYTINQYTTTYNNQGTITTAVNNYDTLLTAPTPEPTKTGYTFTGWFDAATGGNKWDFATSKVVADQTLYAQFSINSYVTTFDDQGNTTSTTNAYGTLLTAPTPEPTKTGYTFVGWFDAATGGTQWNFATSTVANTQTLYAQFTPNAYVTTFDNQGVTTTSTNNYGTLLAEPAAPNKTGYTFTGWFDAATGGTQWNFLLNTVANNQTLYAQFTINQYVTTFNDQGTTTTSTNDYGTLLTEPNAPVKAGHTFVGWFDAATGGNKWNFTTSTVTTNQTLYAQFSVNQYVTTFDNQGVTTTSTNDYGTLLTEPNTPVKAGYTFVGWFDAATGGTQWNFATSTVANNQTLHAQFTINQYVTTFNDQGTTTTSTNDYGTLLTEPTAPVKTGHTFTGWFDAVTGGTKWNFATSTVTTNQTLYAQFSVNQYVTTFDNQGVTTTSTNDYGTLLTEPNAPVKAGYTFVGWFDAATGGTKWNFTTSTVANNQTLYAQFTAALQTITFDTNGGSNIASISANTDSAVDITNVIPTKNGYKFNGWYNGLLLQPNTFNMPAGGLTLTAQYSEVTISGKVFEDSDYDTLDNNSLTKSGVTVKLIDAVSKSVISTTTTDASGKYSFNLVDAASFVGFSGKYAIKVDLPATYVISNLSSDSLINATTLETAEYTSLTTDITNVNIGMAKDLETTINPETQTLYIGDSAQSDITTTNGTIKEMNFTTGGIATFVQNATGVSITAVTGGTDTLNITYYDGYGKLSTVTKQITINAKELPTLSTIDSVDLKINATHTISTIVTPSDVTLTYSSVDATIASVSTTGVITALKKGSTIINVTATTADGLKSVTNQIIVSVDATTNQTNKEAISGHGFNMTVAEYASLNDQFIINKGEVSAWSTELATLNQDRPITNISHNIQPIKGTYFATLTTALGTSITITINVGDTIIVNPSVSEDISAHDFTLKPSDVATLNDATIISKAEAKAWSTNPLTMNEDVTITSVNYTILENEGTYAVTFTTLKGTSITVYAHVGNKVIVNPNNKEAITATNFEINKADVSALNLAKLIELGNAKAWSTDTLTLNAEVTITAVDHSIQAIANRSYAVTYKTALGTSVTIVATVVDLLDPIINNEEDIVADDFTLTLTEAANLNNDFLKTKASAAAWSTSLATLNDVVDITIVDHHIQAVVGSYEVSFITAKGTKITVTATVGQDVIIDKTNKEAISANDFNLTVSEASNITNEIIKTKSQASAWSIDKLTLNEERIITEYNHNILSQVGSYQITLKTALGTTKVITAHVGNDIIVNPVNKEIIDAHDFSITVAEVASLNKATILEKSEAKSWSIDTTTLNTVVDIDSVTHNVVAAKGTYSAVLKTAKGTTKIISIHVGDNVIVDPTNKEAISGHDFNLTIDEAKTINELSIIQKSDAAAWSVDQVTLNENREITSITHNIEPKKGSYAITLKTALGTTKVVYAHVGDNVVVDQTNKEAISASDFNLTLSEVRTILNTRSLSGGALMLANKANATAWSTDPLSLNTSVDITDVTHSLKDVLGTYEVTFKTALGTTITVLAHVGDDLIIDQTNDEAISAIGCTLEISEVASLNKDILITKASAKAWSTATGTLNEVVEIVSAEHNIKANAGTYSVTFKTLKGTSITVDVKVNASTVGDITLPPNSGNSLINTGFESSLLINATLISILGLSLLVVLRRKIRK